MRVPGPGYDSAKICESCAEEFAVESGRCAECAVDMRVHSHEHETAHEIAVRHGISRECVERRILERGAGDREERRKHRDAMIT